MLVLAVLCLSGYGVVVDAFVASALPRGRSTTTTASSSSLRMANSGVARNPNFAKLTGGYLFPEIGRRRTEYLEANPEMASRVIFL